MNYFGPQWPREPEDYNLLTVCALCLGLTFTSANAFGLSQYDTLATKQKDKFILRTVQRHWSFSTVRDVLNQ